MDLLLKYTPLINVTASIILVIVTCIYVLLTKKILEATKKQSQLSLAPSVGISIKSIGISDTFGNSRRNLGVYLELVNIGNAPAVEILVDAEVEYRHSRINGEKLIPSRFEPSMIPYLRVGESNEECAPNFGNTFITHFFDDVRESKRLNIHRIETDPTQESYNASRLYIYCYYRNTLGQFFKSSYEVEIGLDPFSKDPIPEENEKCEVIMSSVPKSKFHIEPITDNIMKIELDKRSSKRDICGW